MPRSKMAVDTYTGRPLAKLHWLDNFSGTNSKSYIEELHPDTNIANPSSMAAIVGKSVEQLEHILSKHPDVIHTHRLRAIDDRGVCLATIHATCVTSLTAGFKAYDAMILERQRVRVRRFRLNWA